MAVVLPNGKQHFDTPTGGPGVGYRLYTYIPGTSTPKATYTTSAASVANTNPVIADALGDMAVYWSGAYDVVLKDAADVTVWGPERLEETTILSTYTAFVASLLASGGAALVGFIQAGTGAVLRTVRDKLRESVSAVDFGAVGDGVTDDTAAILAACASLGATGGTVRIPRGIKCLIDNNLTIPVSVSLGGPHNFVGSPGNNASAPYGNLGGVLIVNSTKTITLSSGAGIKGLLLYRKGMTFPAADASAFAGTCITNGGDDTFVSHSMILGFAQAFTSNAFQRPRIDHLYHDNTAGILIQACFDIPRVMNCHAWPFATIATGAAAAKDTRTGAAYRSTTGGDWNKFTDCFSWGYLNGFIVDGCNSVTLKGCGADHLGGVANSIGFLVINSSQDTRLIGCQAAAQDTGYSISTATGLHTQMNGCDSWGNTLRGVLAGTGDLTIQGGTHRTTSHGILINTTTGVIHINGVRCQDNSTSDIGFNVASATTHIGKDCDLASFAAGTSSIANPANATVFQAVSASTLLIPNRGDIFNVTGTTNISRVSCGWAERVVTLKFGGVLTVANNTGAIDFIRLSGAANFVVTAGGTLTIKHDGVQWFEIGRSA